MSIEKTFTFSSWNINYILLAEISFSEENRNVNSFFWVLQFFFQLVYIVYYLSDFYRRLRDSAQYLIKIFIFYIGLEEIEEFFIWNVTIWI